MRCGSQSTDSARSREPQATLAGGGRVYGSGCRRDREDPEDHAALGWGFDLRATQGRRQPESECQKPFVVSEACERGKTPNIYVSTARLRFAGGRRERRQKLSRNYALGPIDLHNTRLPCRITRCSSGTATIWIHSGKTRELHGSAWKWNSSSVRHRRSDGRHDARIAGVSKRSCRGGTRAPALARVRRRVQSRARSVRRKQTRRRRRDGSYASLAAYPLTC